MARSSTATTARQHVPLGSLTQPGARAGASCRACGSDFRTAKSRIRCSADTYMSAATMMEATIHISMRELSIDEIASSMACTVSSVT